MLFERLQVVALMGAHTLGNMLEENSGYRGPWILGYGRDTLSFDNRYFINMINDSLSYVARVSQ